ncbi:hypothetical protein [Oharaeibacter diazotrophicus]|uniref:Uncharacterized protein n=2 Tax=Oharaeibacter diazotrophicus TaxID=1920512 RepID=A0A4R6RIG5_9HYPH|nr:hypothetical protein [Oharaeibacter diazotrophicus]TDP86253.1 hypothetical protein EDD54_0122 [Oharaeibacter diazotrophicus]BBE71806.1 hypothetical protein OHA_1_01389 [Pleomorphomonas sp. SM30]GLS78571.1 hypothetical protein GCM10007904_39080 [Oharaeibacter diazotrophicus]
MRRALLVVALVAPLFAAPAAEAAGPAGLCSGFGRELGRLDAGGYGAKRYRASAARQREALERAIAESERAGCDFQSRGGCLVLLDTILRMRANLDSLEAMAARSAGAASTRRKEILAQMRAAACTPPATTPRRASVKPARPARPSTVMVRTAVPGAVPLPDRRPRVIPAALSPDVLPTPRPDAATETRPEDWQIPDADASTVPAPAEDGADTAAAPLAPPATATP